MRTGQVLSVCTKLGLLCLATGMTGMFTILSDGFEVSSHQPEPGNAQPETHQLTSAHHEPQTTNHQPPQSYVQELIPGVPIERELAGGEAHTYRVTLGSGQYLHVVVQQRGIDVKLRVIGPDDQPLAEVNRSGSIQGLERVSIIAEVSGSYRLEVEGLEKEALLGRYEVKVEELREATLQDRDRIAAEGALAEGKQLAAQGTAESQRKAIQKYESALSLWRTVGDRRGEADTLNNIGIVYFHLGEPQEALKSYHQALILRRSIGDARGEAEILHNIGDAYADSGEAEKALGSYHQALAIWHAMGDHHGGARTLIGMGEIYRQLGEPEKALESYHQALPMVRTARDRLAEAAALNNIGAIYRLFGENQKALESYGQVLRLVRALGNRRAEAITLNNIGLLYKWLGESEKSLQHYHQSLQLRQAAGDRRGEAITLNNIGLVYDSLGEHQKALEFHRQALSLFRDVGDRRGEAITLTNIGQMYVSLGEPKKALESYHQALSIIRAVGDPRNEAQTLTKMGEVYAGLGEFGKALEHHEQALPHFRRARDPRGEATALHNIGSVYEQRAEPEKALKYYHQALNLRRAVEDSRGEAHILASLARVESNRGNLVDARRHIESVLDIIESLRTKVASQELRASYLSFKQNYYEFYIDLLMQLHQRQPSAGHDAAALQASERTRARSLLETLTEAQADIRQGIDPILLERERTLQQQLNVKADRLRRLLSGKHTEEQAAATRKELEALLTQYQQVQGQIRVTSPRYAALTQPEPLSLREIQQQVLDQDTLLLEYALGQERSFLWAVTPSSIRSYELPKRTEIEATARRAYERLLTSHRREGKRAAELAIAELSQMVMGPVAGLLGKKRLLIVSDGALQYVPFGALATPRNDASTDRSSSQRPLIIDHEIVSLPSASVLAVLRRELADRRPAANTVAVLADPVFNKDDERIKARHLSGEKQPETTDENPPSAELVRSARESGVMKFGRLPFTRQEAEAITSLVSEDDALRAVDFAASRATATSAELRQYQMVHLATHGLINSTHPALSCVVLSLVDEQGRPQDGFLRLHEIYNLKLGAELVVLSACRTALGKQVKGEGLVGLTRGFMYAGAARVVASLWDVRDKATAELMKRFYRGMLKDGLRPAAALRAAQVSMWREKRWAAPYYWAGFVLQGEWR